jgi:hypothetical protein
VLTDTPALDGRATLTCGKPFGVWITCVLVPGVGTICASDKTGSMPSTATPAATARMPDADECGRARASPVADFPSAVAVSATATTIPRSLEYTRRCVFLFILIGAARAQSLIIERELTETSKNDCQKLPSC